MLIIHIATKYNLNHIGARDTNVILPALCNYQTLASTKFQMIVSLITEKDTWGARCGIYDHLPLLSLATAQFVPFFSESTIQVIIGHLCNPWIVINNVHLSSFVPYFEDL